MVEFAAVVPHPPVLIPEIGKKEEQKEISATKKAVEKIFAQLKKIDFDTLVIISPHGLIGRESVPVMSGSKFKGGFGAFGAATVELSFKGDTRLAQKIIETAEGYGIKVQESDKPILDHGSLVPLYFFGDKKFSKKRILPIGIAYSSRQSLYAFGGTIASAAAAIKRKIVIIASADLSHKLKKNSPQGYSEVAKDFDYQVVTAIKRMKAKDILELSRDLTEEAGECGIRPISILLGALAGLKMKSSVLSYEAPFGVGYLTAAIEVVKK